MEGRGWLYAKLSVTLIVSLNNWTEVLSLNLLHVNMNMTECPRIQSGNVPYTVIRSNGFPGNHIHNPIVNTRFSYENVGTLNNHQHLVVRYALVSHPYTTFSVLEPSGPGGCHVNRTFVTETVEQRRCLVAMNGGYFFELGTGAGCIGNIISDGRLAFESGGIQNAHFGIKENGDVFIGYLTVADMVSQKFRQLLGGLLWLIRDGEMNVDESIAYECSAPQNAGTMHNFTNTPSARSAIAVDKAGKVIMIQVDGNTHERGVNLYDFAKILLKYGAVQAVNLDGGGSSTFVINGTLANHPPDICKDDARFRCPRPVATILCVHEPECDPSDCWGHGQCTMGRCQCVYPWTGRGCDNLSCYSDCSSHGICGPRGCLCDTGWHGIDCSQPCNQGQYGIDCARDCVCLNGANCSHNDGSCDCLPGYTGEACAEACPFGFYGKGCSHLCQCEGGCPCHHITGSCIRPEMTFELTQAYQCVASGFLNTNTRLFDDQAEDYRLMKAAVVVLGLVTSVSIVLNIFMLYLFSVSRRYKNTIIRYKQP